MRASTLLVALTSACAHVQAPPTLNNWVAANTGPAEPVICQHEVNGEYFFVARRPDDDKLRLGSRVDLTGLRPETLSWSVAWFLRGEAGSPITAKVFPEQMKNEFLQVDGKTLAENVHYQTVNPGRATRMRVEVMVEKCAVRPCGTLGEGAKRYTVIVCETAL